VGMSEGPAGQPSEVYSRYGLHHHNEVQTGQQAQDRVNQDIKERYGPFIGLVVGLVQARGRVDDMLDSQAASLKAQVLTRSAPAAPDAHYIGIPHAQLHEMVNDGVDSGAVGETGDVWTQIGNQVATFNDEIVKAIGSSETDWTGRAGDGARQALADMGNRAGETGIAAQLAGTLFTQQARSLSTAKNTVPPPPVHPFDPVASQAKLMTITDPIAFIQQAAADRAAFQQQQKDHQEAARAVETYDRTVAQTAAAQPAFAPAPAAPPQPQPEPSPQPPIGGDDSNGRGFTAPPSIGDTTNTSAITPPTIDPGSSTNPSGNIGLDVGKNPPGVGGNQLGANPGGSGPGLGGGFVPGVGPGTGSKGGLGGSRTGGSSSGRGGTGTGVGGGRSPAGSGIGGSNVAKGIGVPNAPKGFGPGGSSGLLSGEGSAGRGGLSPGGAAAGRGGAGTGAMGGMGAGGAKGEGGEDLEHQTPSYLVNEDNGNEIVGDIGMVVPPTLGA